MKEKYNTNNQLSEIKKHRSTFAILFYINRTKIRKDGTCQLLCKVSIDAEGKQISTKVSVRPELWNPDTGRADGKSRNAVEVNRAIDLLTEKIENHYKQIKQSLGFVTAELVKNAVEGIAQKPLTLLALFKEHNEEFFKRVGIDRTQGTYESYENSYNHLSAFVKDKCKKEDVTLRSLNMDFYNAFDLYLRKDRGMKQKSLREHLYRLKRITKRAVNQGTLRCDPYAKQHPKLPPLESRHLALEDLKKLMAKQIDVPNLQFVRDMFIFATFTGLAYADLKRLSEKHITQAEDGSWWIHLDRQKSDTPSAIRLLDIPLRIIEKYRPKRKSDKIFNIYTRDYFYQLIRELRSVYGIDDMTFHTARHNFGTHITLSLGIPIESVSKMMGHRSITTTQIYAHVTDKKIDEDMKKLKVQTADKKVNLYEKEIEIER